MSYFITEAHYVCDKGVIIINATNDEILNDKLFIINLQTNDIITIYTLSKGIYTANKQLDGIYLIKSSITGTSYYVFPSACKDCDNKERTIDDTTCVPSFSTPIKINDVDTYIRYYNSTWTSYEGACKSTPCGSMAVFHSSGYDEITSDNIGVTFAGWKVNPDLVFSFVVASKSTGCIIMSGVYRNKALRPVLPDIYYDCKFGINYNKDKFKNYTICPDLPKKGTILKNGNYRYCIFSETTNDEFYPRFCWILNRDINVNCKNKANKQLCSKSQTDFFEYDWNYDPDDFCHHYNIKNKGYDLKIEILYIDKHNGTCDDIYKSKNPIVYKSTNYTKIATNIKVHPFEDPFIAFNYPVIIRVTVLNINEDCSFDICAVPCALPLDTDSRQLRGAKITRHTIEGDSYFMIENPISNGAVRFESNNIDYNSIICGGERVLFKNETNSLYLRYTLTSINSGDTLKTTINLPQANRMPSGIPYTKNENNIVTIAFTE